MKLLKVFFCPWFLRIVPCRLTILFLVHSSLLCAQTINVAEYFFDTDPGKGNGTALVITTPSDPLTFSFTIPTTGLLPGRHYFCVRTRTSNGNWSLYEPREFFIQAPIAKAEYFFDTDPGIDNATPVSITTVDDFTFTSSLSLGGLPDGDHFLYIRVKDETGIWSLYEPTLFTVDSALPITLTDFSATRNGNRVNLIWATASELNNDYFEVERWMQDDGYTDKSFDVIGLVKGHGTTTSAYHYQFSDKPAFGPETIYYRLKQVDYDGMSTYSQVVAVLPDLDEIITKLYPNPGSTYFTLDVKGEGASKVAVEVLTISGVKLESYENVQRPLVFGNDWPPGVYLVRIIKPNEVLVVKVVKAQ